MTPKLNISSFVMKRLEKIKTDCSGCLFGLMYNGTLLILGFNIELTNGVFNYKKIQLGFPGDIDLCGLVKFGQCTDSEAHLNHILQDVDVTDNPILLQRDLDGTTIGLKASILQHGQLKSIPFDVINEDEIYNNFIYTRLVCDLFILSTEDEQSITNAMQNLRKSVASGRTGFHIKNTNIYLTGGSNSGNNIIGINQDTKINDLLNVIALKSIGDVSGGGIVDEVVNVKSMIKKKAPATTYEILNVSMIEKRTNDITLENRSVECMQAYVEQDVTLSRIPIYVDSLAMLHRNSNVNGLYDILIESLCRTLRLIEKSFIRQILHSGISEICCVKIFHFLPTELGHFFTCVYPVNINDDDDLLKIQRKKFHTHFGLSTKRPYFKRLNRYYFKDEEKTDVYLINPHVGIKSLVKDGQQYLVQGKYSYHHYMQNNYDDNGWGCAYRSLQTLCSWFKLQGFTDHKIPTHIEIQKYLVEIGDKPSSFIGSKQWIGSTEVSMCLNGFMNIVSRILRCDSGADLIDYGPTLAQHFESQGTPIMIGGGVLAHTILGIDFNSTTNDLKFLILDPHYTGSDDLKIVQSKGWCGWKGCDFWDKKSYYNLCMPQLPTDKQYY